MKSSKPSLRLAVGTLVLALSGSVACGGNPSDRAAATSDGGGGGGPSSTSSSGGSDTTGIGNQDAGPEVKNHAPLVTIFTVGGTGNMFDINGSGTVPLGVTPVPTAPSGDSNGEAAAADGGPADAGGGVSLTPAQAAMMDAVAYALITTTPDFDWVPIDYPSAAFPMNQSVATGVARLIAAINALPAGRPFVLEGISQGAIVISKVLQEIQGGSLRDREADLLAGVTFGNLCREPGHLWPNAVDPGAFDNPAIPGHGLLATCRLNHTPDYWWDFVNAGDPATTAGDDPAGRMATVVIETLFTNVTGPGSIGSLVQQVFTNLGFDVGLLPGIVNAVNELALFASPNNPHAQYWSTPPQANPPTTLTSAEVAIDYLASVGATWRSRHH